MTCPICGAPVLSEWPHRHATKRPPTLVVADQFYEAAARGEEV